MNKKSKNINLSAMNVFTGIGIVTVLLGAFLLFFALAVVRGEDGQYALSLFSGRQVAYTPDGDKGESACGFLEEWNVGSGDNSVAEYKGKVYFVDGASDIIRVLNPKDGKITTIGKPGTGPGEFLHPNDIAFDQYDDNMYISEMGQNGAGRLQMLDKDGNYKREWTAKDLPNGGAFLPGKLVHYAIRDNPNVSFDMEYIGIVNTADNKILRLDLDSGKLQSFTTHNISAKILGMATTEYVDLGFQYMFVSTDANKVLKFNLYGGVYLSEWSASADEEFGDLGVFGYQTNNHIYVIDTKKDIIHDFDYDGKSWAPFDGLYDGENKYLGLVSIFYGSDGFLYGTTKEGKVRKFGIDCATLNIHKDVLPGTSDFTFNFSLKSVPSSKDTTRVSHFSIDFSLEDKSPKGSIPSTKKIKVPKGLSLNPYDPNKFIITETKSPDLEAYWQCDYGEGNGKFPEDFPTKGYEMWVNVIKSTVETNCYFYNTNTEFAKLSIAKYTPSEKNSDEFQFSISPTISYKEKISLYDFNAFNWDDIEYPTITGELIIGAGEVYTITELPNPNKKFNVSYECYYQNKDHTRTLYKKGDSNIAQIIAKPLEHIRCTFSNKLIPKEKIEIGTIIIKKDAIPNSQDDTFFFYGKNLGTLSIKDDGTGNNIKKFENVDQNISHSIEEWVDDRRDRLQYYTSISCLDTKNRNVVERINNSLSHSYVDIKFLEPQIKDTITCLFTNRLGGVLTIIKEVPPDGSGLIDFTDFAFNLKGGIAPFSLDTNFTLDDDKYEENPHNTSESYDVPPGGYTLLEKEATNYDTITTCVDKSGKQVALGSKITVIKVLGGNYITCTVVNKKKTGSSTPGGGIGVGTEEASNTGGGTP